jgi:hypothetical protein
MEMAETHRHGGERQALPVDEHIIEPWPGQVRGRDIHQPGRAGRVPLALPSLPGLVHADLPRQPGRDTGQIALRRHETFAARKQPGGGDFRRWPRAASPEPDPSRRSPSPGTASNISGLQHARSRSVQSGTSQHPLAEAPRPGHFGRGWWWRGNIRRLPGGRPASPGARSYQRVARAVWPCLTACGHFYPLQVSRKEGYCGLWPVAARTWEPAASRLGRSERPFPTSWGNR